MCDIPGTTFHLGPIYTETWGCGRGGPVWKRRESGGRIRVCQQNTGLTCLVKFND